MHIFGKYCLFSNNAKNGQTDIKRRELTTSISLSPNSNSGTAGSDSLTLKYVVNSHRFLVVYFMTDFISNLELTSFIPFLQISGGGSCGLRYRAKCCFVVYMPGARCASGAAYAPYKNVYSFFICLSFIHFAFIHW